jgi:hypothetical protein
VTQIPGTPCGEEGSPETGGAPGRWPGGARRAASEGIRRSPADNPAVPLGRETRPDRKTSSHIVTCHSWQRTFVPQTAAGLLKRRTAHILPTAADATSDRRGSQGERALRRASPGEIHPSWRSAERASFHSVNNASQLVTTMRVAEPSVCLAYPGVRRPSLRRRMLGFTGQSSSALGAPSQRTV